MSTIQYVSDIHLEIRGKMPKINKLPDCENICVLGDIGYPHSQIYQDFMKYCSENWKNVFWVMGNHCFYHKGTDIKIMSEIEEYVKQICFNNVYLMNNNSLYLNKNNVVGNIKNEDTIVKIIGSLLWSNISNSTSKHLNDYERIYTHKTTNDFGVAFFTKLTPEYTRKLFETNKAYIIQELLSEPDIPCLILTHHGTHPLCQGFYQGSKLEDGYGTFIPELFENKNLIACINGHVHSNINITLPNGIKLLSNCMGYPGEKPVIVNYNQNAILNLIN